MRKNLYILISAIFVGILVFQIQLFTVIAHDDDDDGVDDSIEDLNERNISVEFEEDHIEVESILRRGINRDEIDFDISNDTNGFSIDIEYDQDYGSEEFEFHIKANFESIIEFNDTNSDNIYNSTHDEFVKEIKLSSFQKTLYSNESLGNNNYLHYFIINSTDGIFTAYLYIAEEFIEVNNSIVGPNQMKVDIEINYFPYDNSTSLLALNTTLISTIEVEREETTEDEEKGYSDDEEWITATINGTTGFLSWNKTAEVDNVIKDVFVGNRTRVGDEEKFYINYLRGDHIYHDPEIGIAGIISGLSVIQDDDDDDDDQGISILDILIYFLIPMLILSASVAIASYYYFNKKKSDEQYIDRKSKADKILSESAEDYLFDPERKREILHKFDEVDDISELSQKIGTNLTAISQKFLEEVNKFDWDYDEKKEFIKEMIALTPKERERLIKEMKTRND